VARRDIPPAGRRAVPSAHGRADALEAEYRAGDHYIVIGRVREPSPPPRRADRPLLYYRGRYHTFA
jgi:hypothetical protein